MASVPLLRPTCGHVGGITNVGTESSYHVTYTSFRCRSRQTFSFTSAIPTSLSIFPMDNKVISSLKFLLSGCP